MTPEERAKRMAAVLGHGVDPNWLALQLRAATRDATRDALERAANRLGKASWTRAQVGDHIGAGHLRDASEIVRALLPRDEEVGHGG